MQTMTIRKTAFQVEPIEVTILGAEGKTHEEVRDFALDATDETVSSTFGSKVTIVGNFATVHLYRD